MVASFLQKPIGAVTVLGTAIGGPYALYETDVGTSARVAVQGYLDPANAATANGMPNADPSAPLSHGMLISAYQGQSPATSSPTGYGSPTGFGANTVTPPNSPPGTTITYGPATIIAMQPYPGSTQYPNGTPYASSAPYPSGGPSANLANYGQQPSIDLRDVFRFDLTQEAFAQRFPQVTTLSATAQFDALRAALVTGTRPTDLAGTLTYFFDARRSVQRIQFYGNTGDPSMLTAIMTQYYQLSPEPSLGGQLLSSRWNNRITSFLHVANAPVMQATTPNTNYIVFLELNQPSVSYGLSPEAMTFLSQVQSR